MERPKATTGRLVSVAQAAWPVLILAALLIVLARSAVMVTPYGYDEADYMHATRLGLAANYTDSPTMPIGDFIRTGLLRGRNVGQAMDLSEMIRGANDVVFYRHWHGPLYFYWLLFTSSLGLDPQGMRWFTLAFPICGLLVIFFGAMSLFPGSQGVLAAILSAALFLWSGTVVRSTEIAPHQAFAGTCLLGLMCLSRTALSGERRYFYLSVIAAALSCCLLEVGFVMVATVIACGYVERKNLSANWAFARRSVLLFTATVLVVWPGALLKLSFVKGYLFMAYLSLFRKSPWGSEGLLDTWRQRIYSSPVEWLVIGAAAVLWLFSGAVKKYRRTLYPFLAFGALMLAATLRVTTGSPRYALSFEPALDVLAGCIVTVYLARFRPAAAFAATAIICAALFSATWWDLRQRPVISDPRASAMLAYVRQNHLDRSRLLVPQDDLPTLHYYFPATRLRGYTGPAPEMSATLPLSTDGILYPGFPIRYRASHGSEGSR